MLLRELLHLLDGARGAVLEATAKTQNFNLLNKKETAHSMDELVQVDGVLAGDHLVQGALLLALALGLLVLTLLLRHLLCWLVLIDKFNDFKPENENV